VRVLVGWLDELTARRLVRSRAVGAGGEAWCDAAVRAAAGAVAARAARSADDAIVGPALLSGAVRERLERGGEDPARVAVVDLARLRARQPFVFTDTPVAGAETDEGRTEMTLPGPGGAPEVRFDEGARAFRAVSRDQNLQVLGEFCGEIPGIPEGSVAVGFVLAAPRRPLRVVVQDGCGVLVDGHHRAVALLAAGHREVTAVIERDGLASHGAEGLLDDALCLGPRAPTLADYLDDEVALDAALHHVGREVVVGALERDLGPQRA